MKRLHQSLFIAITLLSFTTTAWAAPDWWKTPNEPVQPTKDISNEPAQLRKDYPPSTETPKNADKTQYNVSTPNYIALKLGGYLPQASDVEEFDNAFYGELGIGHYFDKNFAVEFGVGYTKPGASVSEFISGVGSASASLDVTIIPVTLGLRGSIPTGVFEPFATAGVGIYFTEAEASVNIPGFISGSASENDTSFGFYLGLGANLNVSQKVYIGVEGKYFWAKPSFEGVDLKIDGINLTANIGFRF